MAHTRLEIKGIIYVILSGLFYGLVGYFGTQALEYSPSIANMLFWRFVIASLFIALFMLPQLKEMKIHWPAMGMIFSASAIFYGSSTFFYFTASQQMGTGIAMVIFFTYPAIVILCNRFIYKHHISPRYYFSVLFILIGLLLLIELKFNFNYLSLFIGLISASGYAFYIMANKKYNQLHPLLAALMVSLGCSFFCLIFALSHNGFFMPTAPAFWVHSLGLGIISTALPILFLLKGLQYINSEKAAILGVLEPIFVALVGVLFLGEVLGVMQTVGVAIVLLGALLSLLSQNTGAEEKKAAQPQALKD